MAPDKSRVNSIGMSSSPVVLPSGKAFWAFPQDIIHSTGHTFSHSEIDHWKIFYSARSQTGFKPGLRTSYVKKNLRFFIYSVNMATKTAKNLRSFIYSAHNRTSLSFGFGGVWQDGRAAVIVADVIETCFVWACPSISGFGWLSWRSHNWSSQRPAGAGHQRPSRPPGKLDISLQSRYQFRISLIMEAEEEVSQVCVSMVVQFAQPAHRIFRKRLDDVYQRSKFSTD